MKRPTLSDEELMPIFRTRRDFRDFLAFEKDCMAEFKRRYPRAKRVIFYLKWHLGYGRRVIAKQTGLSQRAISDFYAEIKVSDDAPPSRQV